MRDWRQEQETKRREKTERQEKTERWTEAGDKGKRWARRARDERRVKRQGKRASRANERGMSVQQKDGRRGTKKCTKSVVLLLDGPDRLRPYPVIMYKVCHSASLPHPLLLIAHWVSFT